MKSTRSASTSEIAVFSRTSTPRLINSRNAYWRKESSNGAKQVFGHFHQHHVDVRRIEFRVRRRDGPGLELGQLTCHFHAGRPAADDDHGEARWCWDPTGRR